MRIALARIGVVVSTLLFCTELNAQIADHLKCYRVKDSLASTTYTADLDGLTLEPGCTVKVPASMLCVQAIKTNVTPPPPGGGGAVPAGRFACYRVKCPTDDLPTIAFADQFGARDLVPSKSQLLCAPETGLANEPPVASAGPDLAPPDLDQDGIETVTLDATASRDPEGGTLLHVWSQVGSVDPNGSLTATLPVGQHGITLTVVDAEGATDDDSVTVTISDVPPGQTVIASDGFESNTYTGGTGWLASWVRSGDVSLRNNLDGPHSGLRHLRLRSSSGLAHRTVNLTGVTAPRLKVWLKGTSFESSDTASIRVGSSTSLLTTIRTFTYVEASNTWRFFEFDLTPFVSATTTIVFDANMSGSSDYLYIDDVEVWGIP